MDISDATVPSRGRHRSRPARRARAAVSGLELIIVSVGLVASAAAGVMAYQIVGLYGDGAFASGYKRVRDPGTGESLLVHESRTEAGIIRRVIDGRRLSEIRFDTDIDGNEETRVHVTGTEITRIDHDRDGDGRVDLSEYYDDAQQVVKTGFSLAGDGVLDAWAYRDGAGELVRIEVSTRRDGTIDRWEYYEGRQLVRVEEDTSRDGRVDRWSTYDDGILTDMTVDVDGDGRPDTSPVP